MNLPAVEKVNISSNSFVKPDTSKVDFPSITKVSHVDVSFILPRFSKVALASPKINTPIIKSTQIEQNKTKVKAPCISISSVTSFVKPTLEVKELPVHSKIKSPDPNEILKDFLPKQILQRIGL